MAKGCDMIVSLYQLPEMPSISFQYFPGILRAWKGSEGGMPDDSRKNRTKEMNPQAPLKMRRFF